MGKRKIQLALLESISVVLKICGCDCIYSLSVVVILSVVSNLVAMKSG